MDKNERKEVKNPREKANFLSVLTFWWTRKLLLLGYKKELEDSDIYSALRQDRSSKLGEIATKAWEKEAKRCEKRNDGSKPRLLRVMWCCFGHLILKAGFVTMLLEFGLRMVQPFLLAKLLHYFSGDRKDWQTDIYYYAAAFCFLPMIDCLIMHWVLQTMWHIGMKMRIACCTLIYRKILRLSNSVLENETSTGQMVNFLSNDANRLDYMVFSVHYTWIGPVQTLLVGYLTFLEVGWSAIIGTIMFLIFIPLQMYMAKRVSGLTLFSALRTDERLRVMNQVIAGVEIIKMYVWETPYSLLVEKARRKEVNVIKKYSIIEQFSFTFDVYVPRLALVATVLTYVLTGNSINAEKVFMITAFYSVLRQSMTIGFPMGMNAIAEGLVSIRRLEKFMMHAEISRPKAQMNQTSTSSLPIYLEKVTAKWDETRDYTLQNVNLSIPSGSFVAIIGQIGSGKSSLLQAILTELPLEKGILETTGKISYAGQRPWIFASSVRQNILFGQPMNEARYNDVVQACQLRDDIDSFPHGDSTMVGERGMNLSGGQRARINLARALYADADIYLLDDPLSAVDARVGSRIVDECIHGFLKDKTRVLVTHQVQYLNSADTIVVMNSGGVEAKGTFEELQSASLNWMEIFQSAEDEQDPEGPKVDRRMSVEEKKPEEEQTEFEPVEVVEKKAVGRVSGTVYLSYWKASKCCVMVVLMFALFIVSQAVASGSDYMLAFWVNIEESSMKPGENGTLQFQWNGPFSRDVVIYLYSGLTLTVVVLCVIETFAFYTVCMRSSQNLHAEMFRSIIRTTMYFYNTNPAGRILNRFSRDIGVIDKRLPFTIFDVLVIGLMIAGTITIVIAVNPWLVIPTIATTIVLYYLRVIYIPTSRAAKRMEGTTRSPVFDHVGATLQGLTTIRAFKAEQILASEFDNHQDLHSATYYAFISVSRMFGAYVELFCLIYVTLITTGFLVIDGLAVAGDIGLVVTQIVSVTMALQWGMRQTAELENHITSVERVLEYSRLDEEPNLDSDSEKKPPNDWPSKGRVEFKDVKLKYGPKGTYVLHGISFTVNPREKIGVVGRTGAGKTSLISALFRLANVEGEILLDGISTGAIALHDFRSKISIIPQEPVLFGGSLRRNLDPFDEYSDSVLWDALEQVQLKETISDMAAGLNTKVSEDGLNFSVGQRQLLCLVRALIRSNKIMVLDEATANVDPQTDSLIQETVRKKFVDCTVFTIAHRLNTIMDSDKILVMDQGRLVEFDHPYILLQNRRYFYNMVQKTGSSMAAMLTEVAKNSFDKNHNSS